MLDPNEVDQVRRLVIDELAEVDELIQQRAHGSYTHLCSLSGVLFYAHSPVGRVLYEFPAPVPLVESPLIA